MYLITSWYSEDKFVYISSITTESITDNLLITRKSVLIFVAGEKYEMTTLETNYKVIMKLSIKSLSPLDFGSYKCVSKNAIGDTDGSIQLYGKYLYYDLI